MQRRDVCRRPALSLTVAESSIECTACLAGTLPFTAERGNGRERLRLSSVRLGSQRGQHQTSFPADCSALRRPAGPRPRLMIPALGGKRRIDGPSGRRRVALTNYIGWTLHVPNYSRDGSSTFQGCHHQNRRKHSRIRSKSDFRQPP